MTSIHVNSVNNIQE